MSTSQIKIKKISYMGVLSALSLILILITRMPILPVAPFLLYDAGDIAIMIGTLMLGFIPGITMTVIVATLQSLIFGSGGVYGAIMHIIATGTFVIVAKLVMQNKKSLGIVGISILVGILSATLIMIPANLIITPFYMGAPVSAVKKLLLPGIIPFNLIKFGINGVVSIIIYSLTYKYINKVIQANNKRKTVQN